MDPTIDSNLDQPSAAPRTMLRDALSQVMAAAQAVAGGARLRKARSDTIEQAAQSIEAAFSQLVDERLDARTTSAEVRFSAPEDFVPGYEAAVAAGAQARTEIIGRRDMLSSQALADRLGVSRETVNQRRLNRELIALQHEVRGFRYPAWQIEPPVRAAMAEVLAACGADLDPWASYLFFTQPEPLLRGKTPLQALRAGQRAAVLRVAVALHEDRFA